MLGCAICNKNLKPLEGKSVESIPSNPFAPIFKVCDECFMKIKSIENGDMDKYNELIQLKDTIVNPAVLSYIENINIEEINSKLNQQKQQQTNKDNEQKRLAEIRNKISSVKTTTGYNFEGHKIIQYSSIISGESVLGTGFFSEFTASVSDFLGEESNSFSNKLSSAKNFALDRLIKRCALLDCNAIIGIDFDYITFANNMIGVVANGTAVKIEEISN